MKKYLLTASKKQKGAATLFTAVMILVAITLVAFLSGKTVLNETKIIADNYRITQATTAANYAMDLGVNYFDNGGFDQLDESGTTVLGSDNVVDSIGDLDGDGVFDNSFTGLTLISNDANQSTSAQLAFDNSAGTRCVAAGSSVDMKHGMITATGFSDDGLATREITQCVGPIGLLHNDGPKQPLVAQGNVALTGNARIINRYTNTTIWGGGYVTIGSSSAMETYIKAPGVGDLDPGNPVDLARLLDVDEDIDTLLVSNRDLGNGLDIIDNDPSLGTLIGIDFFKNFFTVATRQQLKALAGSRVYDTMDDAIADNPSGLIWIEASDGEESMTGGTLGSAIPAKPVIVYVNGDFNLGGTAKIYGLLYVAGKYRITGTPAVIGSNIVEGTDIATESLAESPIVTGLGTISLVYWQGFVGNSANPLSGLTTVIAGSWRDW